MTKRQFLVILYLLVGIIPLTAQTFTEQKKSYPVSADGNKYVVSGFTPFSDMQDENIYANALLWIVKNVCPQLREGIAEVNVPAKNFSCDLILASQADSSQKNTYYCKAPMVMIQLSASRSSPAFNEHIPLDKTLGSIGITRSAR